MERVSRYFSFAGIIIFVITVICYYQTSITRERVIVRINPNDVLAESKSQTKNILLWNGYDRIEMKVFLRSLPNNISCLYRNCRVTTDRRSNLLGKFDAIIFNMAVLHQLKTDKLPPADTRKSHQYYIFFSQESPFYHKENVLEKDYIGYFNWSMSYLPESNIPYPYGRIERVAAHQAVEFKSCTRKKTKLVAWFVSHCNTTQSRRENYVRELQKHIPIDIFGLCGPLKCNRNPDTGISHPECYDMLEKEYKFYLSFENSLCSDYVTEKFYSILKLDVVPVVMGRANYSGIAPPYSFIDALRYSPKELADYLLLLDGNQTLYERYLEWKTSYIIRSGYQEMGGQAFCSLCRQLNLDDRKEMPADVLSSTWNPTTRCLNPRYMKAFHSIDLNNSNTT